MSDLEFPPHSPEHQILTDCYGGTRFGISRPSWPSFSRIMKLEGYKGIRIPSLFVKPPSTELESEDGVK